MKNLVKTMLMSILTAGTMMSFTACSSEDDVLMETKGNVSLDINQYAAAERTVLVYLAGKNNLSKSLQTNLEQMKAGSKRIGNNTLLAFVRRDIQGEQPWLARISNGELTDSLSLDDMGISTNNMQACNPELMEQVLKYAYSHYPANEYGLVLGGHSTGWLIEQEPGDTRAFGVDNGDGYAYSNNSKRWINVPTMASVLERVPHLKFIFADCCNFMCLETMRLHHRLAGRDSSRGRSLRADHTCAVREGHVLHIRHRHLSPLPERRSAPLSGEDQRHRPVGQCHPQRPRHRAGKDRRRLCRHAGTDTLRLQRLEHTVPPGVQPLLRCR